MPSTPLQDLIGSIVALLPGLIPYLFLVWVLAAIMTLVSLAIDERNGEAHPLRSSAWFGLRIGIMFTIVLIANEANAKGLISSSQFGIASLAAFFSGMSFSVTKSWNPAPAASSSKR